MAATVDKRAVRSLTGDQLQDIDFIIEKVEITADQISIDLTATNVLLTATNVLITATNSALATIDAHLVAGIVTIDSHIDGLKPTGFTTYVSEADIALTPVFQLFAWGHVQYEWDIWNDEVVHPSPLSPISPLAHGGYIEWSWDGVHVAGRIYPGEHWEREKTVGKSGVYLRGQAGGERYRTWSR